MERHSISQQQQLQQGSRSKSLSVPVPALALHDISLSLSTSPVPHLNIPTLPRLNHPTKQSTRAKPRRPSTASSAEDKHPLLPSAPDLFSSTQLPSSSSASSDTSVGMIMPQCKSFAAPSDRQNQMENSLRSQRPSSLQEVNKRAHEAIAGLRAEASRLSADVLPSPFDPSPSEEYISQSVSSSNNEITTVDYDWATFINAYSLGRWDPLKTPHPPRSYLQAPVLASSSKTLLHDNTRPVTSSKPLETISDSPESVNVDVLNLDGWELAQEEGEHLEAPTIPSGYEDVIRTVSATQVGSGGQLIPPTTSVLPEAPLSRLADRRTNISLRHGTPSGLTSGSGSNAQMIPSIPSGSASTPPPVTTFSNTDLTTSAAAIRWAAAHVSVAPLALPSPEHELTDPMRGVTAAIPGSHPPDSHSHHSHSHPHSHTRPEPLSPTGLRKSRLGSFWQGTQDIEESPAASTVTTPSESTSTVVNRGGTGLPPPATHLNGNTHNKSSIPMVPHSVPPATAPIRISTDLEEDDDYFGTMDGSYLESALTTSSEQSNTSNLTSPDGSIPSISLTRPDLELLRQASAPTLKHEANTVPALPRRICLTRQTSAPLPTVTLYERRAGLNSSRPINGDGAVVGLAARAAKEEQMFNELGYLAPPNPPDELERRRALYKFNIWNTGHDVNFDRIVHLVKLVFSTRMVIISLVDGTEVFHKSESGLTTQNLQRTSSFDAHALLQRDDEPTVVLDASEDWRFAKNPLVTGHPRIRFYAGCPLRTQDGFNIGVLSIIDDTPRREFSPRQRHTLKEFAQIAMRELELWRDKIQLRIRDRIQSSMEQFTRECLEVDKDPPSDKAEFFKPSSMEQIYEQAARLVKRTLDVEGAIVLDVSHVDVLETFGSESSTSITLHNADPQLGTSNRDLCTEEHLKLQEFFAKFPQGKISEGIVPAALRPFLPSRIQYALTVPIINIDKRPFAVLCAYSTGERTTPFLEGHELSYLRAIGVIILSAVLKRRMILADKAKSLFISNISHELRTPLHGILASAELLSETQLDHSQASFLQTVQACGMSLVETVNHVLDFTKLSGNAKAGGVENVINRSRVDLMQLVEEATEGCWIGHRARMFTSEIGSVYSPPKTDWQKAVALNSRKHVETVIDIGHNERGWMFNCERGGIRRILMNLFGNSLKFTSDGYVHVMLRQLEPTGDQPTNTVKIELSVIDTGKGISQDFLKNQLFHPFSQENPLQTGTGLGLAIVNSIVRSTSVDGKVDVWSSEGVGTEIKVTFTAEQVDEDESSNADAELMRLYQSLRRPTITLLGFDQPHRGVQLLKTVLSSNLVSRWGFSLTEGDQVGDIVIVNEDPTPIIRATEVKDIQRPFILLSANRGDPRIKAIMSEYERIGGFCRIAFKPVGPYRLFSVLKLCLHAYNIAESNRLRQTGSSDSTPTLSNGTSSNSSPSVDGIRLPGHLPRRFSEEAGHQQVPTRPPLGPRAITVHSAASWSQLSIHEQDDDNSDRDYTSDTGVLSHSPSSPTIAVGTGGTLLKSSVGTLQPKSSLRVLVVEDNSILRNLLVKWLKNKGFDYFDAVDGLDGVNVFESSGPFDVVLVDLSMPVLDGVGATAQMRDLEASHPEGTVKPARILALTGMSSLEDKRRAFQAGVDGYLVKPVAFKTLDAMFRKLGFS
ncbi:hypothetical protein ABKN59_002599 [Abortiporus biennis]